jgi:phosphohistidine phosphatase
MKEIVFMRHGKAEKGYNKVDFDRELYSPRITDLKLSAERLKSDFKPDLILSSSAVRTKETTINVVEFADWKDVEVQFLEKFYNAEMEVLIEELSFLPNTIQRVMLVGHNPSITETAFNFCFLPRTLRLYYISVGSFVRLKLDMENWSEIGEFKNKGIYVDNLSHKEM